jgi:hypothetical protein
VGGSGAVLVEIEWESFIVEREGAWRGVACHGMALELADCCPLSEDDEKKISALLTRVELGGKVMRGKTIRQLCGVTGRLSASHEHFRNERRVASSSLTTII